MSTPARRNTNARSLVAEPGVLVRITCGNSEHRHHHRTASLETAICSLCPFSYRTHLSPGSRRSSNSLLAQSRISAQSRKTAAPPSSILTVPQPTPLIVDVPYTIIDGPSVIQIPPVTLSDRSSPPQYTATPRACRPTNCDAVSPTPTY